MKHRHWLPAAAGLTLALTCAGASAITISEREPNNTGATAQAVLTNDSTIRINGARTFTDPSDDFFSFDVRQGGLLSIVTSSRDFFADSILGLYSPSGLLLASSDDAPGRGLMSAIQFLVPAGLTGRFTIGFSGYNPARLTCSATVTECYDVSGDFVFDNFVAGGGAGGSTGWDYAIDIGGVSLVPEPGALALWALGVPLLAAVARRRREPHPTHAAA
ncbi:MAG: hypothetical protein LH480_05560 [Rubrivivax sp.]|nr:hypothetical protein [Rubrivivax sp.]